MRSAVSTGGVPKSPPSDTQEKFLELEQSIQAIETQFRTLCTTIDAMTEELEPQIENKMDVESSAAFQKIRNEEIDYNIELYQLNADFCYDEALESESILEQKIISLEKKICLFSEKIRNLPIPEDMPETENLSRSEVYRKEEEYTYFFKELDNLIEVRAELVLEQEQLISFLAGSVQVHIAALLQIPLTVNFNVNKLSQLPEMDGLIKYVVEIRDKHTEKKTQYKDIAEKLDLFKDQVEIIKNAVTLPFLAMKPTREHADKLKLSCDTLLESFLSYKANIAARLEAEKQAKIKKDQQIKDNIRTIVKLCKRLIKAPVKATLTLLQKEMLQQIEDKSTEDFARVRLRCHIPEINNQEFSNLKTVQKEKIDQLWNDLKEQELSDYQEELSQIRGESYETINGLYTRVEGFKLSLTSFMNTMSPDRKSEISTLMIPSLDRMLQAEIRPVLKASRSDVPVLSRAGSLQSVQSHEHKLSLNNSRVPSSPSSACSSAPAIEIPEYSCGWAVFWAIVVPFLGYFGYNYWYYRKCYLIRQRWDESNQYLSRASAEVGFQRLDPRYSKKSLSSSLKVYPLSPQARERPRKERRRNSSVFMLPPSQHSNAKSVSHQRYGRRLLQSQHRALDDDGEEEKESFQFSANVARDFRKSSRHS
jgi:hypothetical protein